MRNIRVFKQFVFGLLVSSSVMFIASCGSSKKTQNEAMMMQMMQMMQQQQNQGKINQSESDTEDKVKEWKEQGYQLTGAYSTFTMKSVLEMHNQKAMDVERYQALQGNALGNEVSDSRMFALNDAATNYATAAGSIVSGGIARQFSNTGEIGVKLVAAYTQKVAEFLTPHMRESFSLYRKNGNKIELMTYFLVDQENAYKARKNAMDAALKETATEQVFGTAVNEWVKEFISDVPKE